MNSIRPTECMCITYNNIQGGSETIIVLGVIIVIIQCTKQANKFEINEIRLYCVLKTALYTKCFDESKQTYRKQEISAPLSYVSVSLSLDSDASRSPRFKLKSFLLNIECISAVHHHKIKILFIFFLLY